MYQTGEGRCATNEHSPSPLLFIYVTQFHCLFSVVFFACKILRLCYNLAQFGVGRRFFRVRWRVWA